MIPPPDPSRLVGLLVVLASTCSEAVGQFGFKKASERRHPAAGAIAAVLGNWRWLAVGFGGFIVDGILWSVALKMLPLTIAHPAGSLVFVSVAVFSRLFLHEKVSARRWAGIACILVGVVLVVST
jgi:drug/metabolite transporter (DMT)-like permease